MARAQKAKKSESLTIRLDPKTRFILEYLSRLKGQSITTVVERAITSAADREPIQLPNPFDEDIPAEFGWQHFWHVSEGIRALRIAETRQFYPEYEEEKRLAFCKEHW